MCAGETNRKQFFFNVFFIAIGIIIAKILIFIRLYFLLRLKLLLWKLQCLKNCNFSAMDIVILNFKNFIKKTNFYYFLFYLKLSQ